MMARLKASFRVSAALLVLLQHSCLETVFCGRAQVHAGTYTFQLNLQGNKSMYPSNDIQPTNQPTLCTARCIMHKSSKASHVRQAPICSCFYNFRYRSQLVSRLSLHLICGIFTFFFCQFTVQCTCIVVQYSYIIVAKQLTNCLIFVHVTFCLRINLSTINQLLQ